jgi:hypothetical protein
VGFGRFSPMLDGIRDTQRDSRHIQTVSMYYAPTAANHFLSFVEFRAASYFVAFGEPGKLASTSQVKLRYRALTICGFVDATDPIWEVAQIAAHSVVKTTFQPIEDPPKR